MPRNSRYAIKCQNQKYNKAMLLKDKCMAKTRHEFAFSKLRRYEMI